MSDADDFFGEVPTGVVATDDVPRDGMGRYLLPDPTSGEVYGHTRVSTLATSMDSGYGLGPWRENCTAKGFAYRPDLVARVGAADPEDPGYKKLMKSINAAAFEAGGGSHGSNLGTAQHTAFERHFFKGEPIENLPEFFHADLYAVRKELADKGVVLLPEYIEQVVRCHVYGRGGKIDAIGRLSDGTLAIVDLKTEKDPAEYPEGKTVQLAYYANADAVMNYATQQYEPMPPVRRDFALVIWCRPGSGVAKLYEVPIDLGWMGARVAEELRAWKQQKLVVRPYIPGAALAPPVISRPGKQAEVYQAAVASQQVAQPTYPCGDCGAPDYQHGPHTAQCSQNPANMAAYQAQNYTTANAAQVLNGQADGGQPAGLSHVIGSMVDRAMADGDIGPDRVAQLNQQAAQAQQGYVRDDTGSQGVPAPTDPRGWAANGKHPSTMAEAGFTGPVPLQPPGQPVVGPGTNHALPQDQQAEPPAGSVPDARPPVPKGSSNKMSPGDLINDLISRSADGIDPEAFYLEMVAELATLSKKDQLQPALELIEPGIPDKELRCHREPLAQKIVDRVKRQRDIRAQQAGSQPSAFVNHPEAQESMAQAQQYAQQVTQAAGSVHPDTQAAYAAQQAANQPAPWGQQQPDNFVDMSYEGVMNAIAGATHPDRLGAIYSQWINTYGPQQWTGTILEAANAKLAELNQRLNLQPTH